jgi:hypothetical protein
VTWGKKPLVRSERVVAVQGLQDPGDAANLAVQLRPPLLPQRMQVLGRHLPPLRQRTPPRLEKNKRQQDTRNPKCRRLLLATTGLRRTCHLGRRGLFRDPVPPRASNQKRHPPLPPHSAQLQLAEECRSKTHEHQEGSPVLPPLLSMAAQESPTEGRGGREGLPGGTRLKL